MLIPSPHVKPALNSSGVHCQDTRKAYFLVFLRRLKLLQDETRKAILLAVGIGGAFLMVIRYGIHSGYLIP
ncbi:hypothetical protein CO674_10395 [Rhizobium hidalgonense]|uniref:Uncharacterized protein n=1 Tax=Rhizobium hidalgonense TaxID=1538159 RepID=A0ABX4JXQ7_9HYPH|nr:hypothetical protein CO674_10395 [Rhizobium hidalgonense]PON04062.1 hypothetical protein ATY29_30195 [Rhizobium hidalgonense]